VPAFTRLSVLLVTSAIVLGSNSETEVSMADEKVARIRELNDKLRTTGEGGNIVMTYGVKSLSGEGTAQVMRLLRGYDDFNEDNDPHGEHDFGSFQCEGHTLYFKIDYYDKSVEYGSDDPSDATVTHRVLTVMLADEY